MRARRGYEFSRHAARLVVVSPGELLTLAALCLGFAISLPACKALPIWTGTEVVRRHEVPLMFLMKSETRQEYKWCGPGYPEKPPPTDCSAIYQEPSEESGLKPNNDLDRACMHHDRCYDCRSVGDCECDQKLVEEILRGRPCDSPELTADERKVVDVFLYSACRGGCKQFVCQFRESRVCGSR